MKILIYSEKDYIKNVSGWCRGGKNIIYKHNGIVRNEIKYNRAQNTDDNNKILTYRTLSFSYEFQNDDDIIYFTYCYPYTYSDLQEYLKSIEKDSKAAALLLIFCI